MSAFQPLIIECKNSNKSVTKQYGFSLLEVLIAMVIIAIVTAMVFPNFSQNNKKDAQDESRKLYALIAHAKDEAVLKGIELGIRIKDNQYEFMTLGDDDLWYPLEQHQYLKPREIPENLEFNVSLESSQLLQTDNDNTIFEKDLSIFEKELTILDDGTEKFKPPEIFLLSSGEQNEFKLAIGMIDDEEFFFRIIGKLNGELILEGPIAGNLYQDLDKELPNDY